MERTHLWTTLALVALASAFALPGASADDPNCYQNAEQTVCMQQGGNCNANFAIGVTFWIGNDCSNTQTMYYCNSAAGSGALSAGVAAGASTKADGTAGASAGGGCTQADDDDDDGGNGGGGSLDRVLSRFHFVGDFYEIREGVSLLP